MFNLMCEIVFDDNSTLYVKAQANTLRELHEKLEQELRNTDSVAAITTIISRVSDALSRGTSK